ncbi:hypothetical protein OTK01_000321 [Caldicellulosiruptor acetigenus]|uniref:hypothetical protein n=1 Tax=Caldicellulosiruptor acetigenus TaxID=301953 RepID=UPI0022A95BBB|nr:hypothetical protein [Caldicellulosiruptor acetigenus]WAM36547.1 hypothetical protein OTK01_000321 [Caldicellulosiruptor acetigenus]
MAPKLIPVSQLIEKYDKRPAWQKKISDMITHLQIMLIKIKIKIKTACRRKNRVV